MKRLVRLLPLLLFVAFVSASCKGETSDVPPAGTRATSTSEAFKRLAGDLQKECELKGGCTCILDGIQTRCSVVFACLDFGFCQRVATQ